MAIITGTWPLKHKSAILDLIRSLGFPNMQTGPWVAGGAVRRLMQNDSGLPSGFDIDIFASSRTTGQGRSADEIEHMLRARPDFAKVVSNPGRHNRGHRDITIGGSLVQVISHWVYPSAEALIADFDYTICMFATDGWTWIADQRALDHLRARRLVLSETERRRNSTHRLGKYCLYGFTPAPGALAATIGIESESFAARFIGPHISTMEAY